MKKKTLRRLVSEFAPGSGFQKLALKLLAPDGGLQPIAQRSCNICGYHGWFSSMGRPPRLDARCPRCLSLERHRLLMLAIERGQIPVQIAPADMVLHFAPEPRLEQIFRQQWSNYKTADLFRKADLKLDIEAIEIKDNTCKLIIANHVLEHVDDRRASRELHRILQPGGILLCMVPIVEGWETTYEAPDIVTEEMRWQHFGQGDHLRYFGRDFRQRIASGGLELIMEITAEGADVVKFGLVRGEKVFVFRKPENS